MDYWNILLILLGVIVVLLAVRFAFPRLQVAAAFGFGIVMVIAAFVPGVPVGLRVGCLAVAVMTVVALISRRESDR